jgi:hypothetical protein
MKKPIATIAALAALSLPATASARTYLVNPYKAPMTRLQRVVDHARCQTPPTTIMVWPLEDIPGTGPNTGAVDFEGQRPFLIGEPAKPSAETLFHEIGHVLDDGWMTPAQRIAFATAGVFPANLWFFPDGSDAVSDNFAQTYALACMYGAHPPKSVILETAGITPAEWSAEYAIVGQVVSVSLHTPVAAAHEAF